MKYFVMKLVQQNEYVVSTVVTSLVLKDQGISSKNAG